MAYKRLIVQKYGGSSLSSPERIHAVADRIAARADGQNGVIVTVSAMGETTDELMRLAHAVTESPPQREMDMLLTVGERITMALLSMALCDRGCAAISFTGSQSGIVTTVSHSRALIEEIRGERVEEALAQGKVVIVAGFQGVSRTKEITTLGRGGSDTTAVAMAARLEAEQCEIYSDFPGVFTADPRVVENAKPIAHLSHDVMLELAALGARVLHFRAAEIARRFDVTLELRSSFEDKPGTVVNSNNNVEESNATSITCNKDICCIRISGVDAQATRNALDRLRDNEAHVVSYSRNNTTIDVVVDARDQDAIAGVVQELGDVGTRNDLATVSVVGHGLNTSTNALAAVEKTCADSGIAVHQVHTTPLSITCVIDAAQCDDAVKALHAVMVG